MSSLYKSISLVSIVIYSCLLYAYCSQESDFAEVEVNNVLQETFKCHNRTAMAVAVVRDGQVLLSRGFGTLGLDNSKPVTGSSVFGVASLTKVFTATVFLKLLKEKTSLNVNSPINNLLDGKFQMADELVTSKATFADLLSHRMGIPDHNMLRFDTNFTRDTLIRRLANLPSTDLFRVKYYYSNLMYGLVARLTEIIGGKKWEELVTDILLTPLGMNSSTFASVADLNRDDIVTPYENPESRLIRVHSQFSRNWAELPGSGSFMTSSDDMAKWMNFHLSGGKTSNGDQVIDKSVIKDINQPRFYADGEMCKDLVRPKFPETCMDSLFCLGLRTGHYRGYQRHTHTGSTKGYRAVVSLLTDPSIGVFIALNGKDDNLQYRNPLMMYLTDKALGLDSWLNVSTICSYPEPWKKKAAPANQSEVMTFSTHSPHQHYEGTYHNAIFGYMTIIYNESLATLEMKYGWGRWSLLPQSEGKSQLFNAQGLQVNDVDSIKPISFMYDDQGTITAVNATGFLTAKPPIFQKQKPSADSGVSKLGNSVKELIFVLIVKVYFLYAYNK